MTTRRPPHTPAAYAEVAWRENHDLFLAELKTGRVWQEWAAAELKIRGLRVELPEFEFRKHVRDADHFTATDCDLTILGSAVGDCVLEVKSRDIHFIDAPGYPYPTAMIDTVSGWEAKQVEPRAVLLVSRTAQRMLVATAATRPAWKVARKRDAVRGIWDDFYECPREYLRSMDWLVKKLRP